MEVLNPRNLRSSRPTSTCLVNSRRAARSGRNLPGTLPTVITVQGVDKQPKREFLPSATLSFHYQLDNASIQTSYPKVMRIQAVGVTYGPQESTFEDIYSDELTLSVAVMRVEREDCQPR